MHRNRWLRLTIAIVASTHFASGCTGMRVVPPAAGAVLPADITLGKKIRIAARDGVATDLTVTAIGPDYIEGRTSSGTVRIPFVDVSEVRERRFAPGRTIALTLGMLYLAYAVAVVSLWSAAAAGL